MDHGMLWVIWCLLQRNGAAFLTLAISMCWHGVLGISAVIIGGGGAFLVCFLVVYKPAGPAMT